MKRLLYAIFLLLNLSVFSQESTIKFSFEFKDANLKTVIESIEKNSNYKFILNKNG